MISVIQKIKSRSSEVFGKEISENVITDYISNFSSNYPEKYAWQLYDTVLQGISKVRGIGLDTLEEKGFQVTFQEPTSTIRCSPFILPSLSATAA